MSYLLPAYNSKKVQAANDRLKAERQASIAHARKQLEERLASFGTEEERQAFVAGMAYKMEYL